MSNDFCHDSHNIANATTQLNEILLRLNYLKLIISFDKSTRHKFKFDLAINEIRDDLDGLLSYIEDINE